MTVTTLGYRLTTLLTIVLVSVTYCKAQLDQSARKQPGEKARATEASSKLRVDEIISRLSALASDAQTFEPALRSHIQTQAASLLWDFDRLFARDLFLGVERQVGQPNSHHSELYDRTIGLAT